MDAAPFFAYTNKSRIVWHPVEKTTNECVPDGEHKENAVIENQSGCSNQYHRFAAIPPVMPGLFYGFMLHGINASEKRTEAHRQSASAPRRNQNLSSSA